MDISELSVDMFIFKRTCGKCDYGWFPRSKQTKRCPRCQTWLENMPVDEENVKSEK